MSVIIAWHELVFLFNKVADVGKKSWGDLSSMFNQKVTLEKAEGAPSEKSSLLGLGSPKDLR